MSNIIKQITIVLLVAMISGIIFYFGDKLYQTNNVEQPVVKEVTSIEDIREVKVEQQEELYLITLDVDQNSDLEKVYYQAQGKVENILGHKNYQIQFVNSPSRELNEYWDFIEPILFEGINKSNYTWMIDQLSRSSSVYNLNQKLWLDGKNLYMHIQKDKNRIIQVIPLSTPVSIMKNPKEWGEQ